MLAAPSSRYVRLTREGSSIGGDEPLDSEAGRSGGGGIAPGILLLCRVPFVHGIGSKSISSFFFLPF